ncbi:MAG: alanine racemase [Lachnospiraceae bacterium]|nr:alanine racemase [Lachnospiraceae bacterium]
MTSTFECHSEDTPRYVLNGSKLHERLALIKDRLGGLPLVFSMKANPFLIHLMDINDYSHIEVCSPGELAICEDAGILPEKIIYSGVNKGASDIMEALSIGSDILTIESLRQAEIINELGVNRGVRVLVRLTSGNQFGMDEDSLINLLQSRNKYPNLEFLGLHYYGGTQKSKLKSVEKDLSKINHALQRLATEAQYSPAMIEYGPGLAADYFSEDPEKADIDLLQGSATLILENAGSSGAKWSIEMGRFIAAPAGRYETSVSDIKISDGINYAILNGGIHHLNYYGQNMAMKVPPIRLNDSSASGDETTYTLCGSLCTVSDVLVREVKLPRLSIGDTLVFDKCGAYSMTEAPFLFLSRDLPSIWVDMDGKLKEIRPYFSSSKLNSF